MTESKCSASFEQESNAVEPPKKLWHRPEVSISSVPGVTASLSDKQGVGQDGFALCASWAPSGYEL